MDQKETIVEKKEDTKPNEDKSNTIVETQTKQVKDGEKAKETEKNNLDDPTKNPQNLQASAVGVGQTAQTQDETVDNSKDKLYEQQMEIIKLLTEQIKSLNAKYDAMNQKVDQVVSIQPLGSSDAIINEGGMPKGTASPASQGVEVDSIEDLYKKYGTTRIFTKVN